MKLLLRILSISIPLLFLSIHPAAQATESLAREITHLNAMKEGLLRETKNLKNAEQIKMQSLENELLGLEKLRASQQIEVDKLETDLQTLQQRNRVSGAVGVVEAASRELIKELSRFSQNSEKEVPRKRERVEFDSALSRFLEVLDEARAVLVRSSEVRSEARGFALVNGESVQGKVQWIGETSAIGIANGMKSPLSPDGQGGWKALRPLQEKLTSLVIYSNSDAQIDVGISASFGDRALGLVPLVWLCLLGVAVTWLFALIAKN